MRASYNITDDRLRLDPEGVRLTPEQYEGAKAAGFSWWPGQKIFIKVWTPSAEDFLTVTLGLTVEESDEGDDVTARVERFSKYAANAEKAVESVEQRADAGRLNTERRERLALGVMEREADRARHWHDRIAGAIAHAARKDSPHVILGRIKKLEALRRKCAKHQKEYEERRAVWEKCATAEDVRAKLREDLKSPWEEVRARFIEKHNSNAAHYGRWVAHCAARLEYERAYLEAVGGSEVAAMASGAVKIEKGGAIQGDRWPLKDGLWYTVTKVNPKTVEVFDSFATYGNFPKIPREFVAAHKTAAEAVALAKESEQYAAHQFPPGETVRGFCEKRDAAIKARREALRGERAAA